MFKKTKPSTALLIALGFTLIACQKQDTANPPAAKANLAAMSRTDNKDYKIPSDTATAWAARFQQLNSTKMNNNMPAVISLPHNGILQLQAEAAAHNVQLSGIAIHFSVKQDGTIGVFYTPIGMDGMEIKGYDSEANFAPPKETYDGSEACGGYGGPC